MQALRIAHRGVKSDRLENTLSAFSMALDVADGIELDVQIAKCGTPVVFHDDTLERLFDRPGRVSDYSAARLNEFVPCVANPVFASRSPEADERIPTLRDVLNLVPADVFLNVEIKAPKLAIDTPTLAVAQALQGDNRNVLVSCFNPLELVRFHRHAPTIPTALLFGSTNGPILRSGWFAKLLRLNALTAIHPEWKLVSHQLIEDARASALDVNVWTVNEKATARWLDEVGVSAIISDCPHRI